MKIKILHCTIKHTQRTVNKEEKERRKQNYVIKQRSIEYQKVTQAERKIWQ